jgi:phage shock protein PspC (stress-responsive transcriptional regulator)
MKKTVQVNLSGQVFTLDEDAYDLLSNYLHQIGRLYDRSPGKDEIITDIELRIAELLLEKMEDNQQVVTKKDVESVILIMGRPEEFESDESFEENTSTSYASTEFGKKRLYRDQENGMAGGVCAGIAHYFGTEPLWIRLILLIAMIFGGTGFFIYVLLWILVPPAHTAAEKLSMKGEPVNINSIGKTIEDEINNFGDRLPKDGKKFTRGVASGLDRFFHFIAELLRNIFLGLGKVFGVLFLMVGLFSVVGLLAAVFGVADFFHWGTDDWGNSMSLYELGDIVFSTSEWFVSALIGLMIVVTIPFIGLAYGGFSLLVPRFRVPYLGVSLLGIWFIGVAIVIFTAFGVGREFSKEDTSKSQLILSDYGLNSDTIIVELGADPFHVSSSRSYRSNRRDFIMKMEGDEILFGNISFEIEESRSEEATLEILKSSQGASFDEARNKAAAIDYVAEIDSNAITLDAFFRFPMKQLLRDQDVRISLKIPEGKVVYLAEGVQRVIDDIDNVQDIYDPDMVNHHWKMTKRGLSCLDCTGRTQKVDGEYYEPESGVNIIIENN